MRFRLEFDTDNAAFDDHPATEMARILIVVAGDVAGGDFDGVIRDINGNTVGSYSLTKVVR